MCCKEEEALLVAISYGKILPQQLVALVVPKEAMATAEPSQTPIARLVQKIRGRTRGQVRVSGLSDMLITFGRCCGPVPGDSIVGYVTRGKGVSVHCSDCAKLLATDPDRRVDVTWDTSSPVSRIAKLRVVCVDRPGLLAAMTDAITHHGVNIAQATVRTTEEHQAVNTFEVEITDLNQLRKIIQSLEKVKGIIAVERVRN